MATLTHHHNPSKSELYRDPRQPVRVGARTVKAPDLSAEKDPLHRAKVEKEFKELARMMGWPKTNEDEWRLPTRRERRNQHR